jgi:anaerobic ribonucleoside-triphosphate reductase
MTVKEQNLIEDKITELKTRRETQKGTSCEVYSRVVGYLRPVMMWNKGKREEFSMRKNIKVSCGCGKD